jgi:hypothetical protein
MFSSSIFVNSRLSRKMLRFCKIFCKNNADSSVFIYQKKPTALELIFDLYIFNREKEQTKKAQQILQSWYSYYGKIKSSRCSTLPLSFLLIFLSVVGCYSCETGDKEKESATMQQGLLLSLRGKGPIGSREVEGCFLLFSYFSVFQCRLLDLACNLIIAWFISFPAHAFKLQSTFPIIWHWPDHNLTQLLPNDKTFNFSVFNSGHSVCKLTSVFVLCSRLFLDILYSKNGRQSVRYTQSVYG